MWDYSFEDAACTYLQAWVCVYLYQPCFQILIYHEIKAEYLEIVQLLRWTQVVVSAFYYICCYSLHKNTSYPHFWINNIKKLHVISSIRRQSMQISLQLIKSKFISLLIFTILFTIFLYSIIG